MPVDVPVQSAQTLPSALPRVCDRILAGGFKVRPALTIFVCGPRDLGLYLPRQNYRLGQDVLVGKRAGILRARMLALPNERDHERFDIGDDSVQTMTECRNTLYSMWQRKQGTRPRKQPRATDQALCE